jgi:hypothetical protein
MRKSASNTFSDRECQAFTDICYKLLRGDLKGSQDLIRSPEGVKLYRKFLGMRERMREQVEEREA